MKKVVFPTATFSQFSLYEQIEIHGKIFCGRDAVLPKIVQLYEQGKLEESGIDLIGSVIFHTAVSQAGIGPTSSNKQEIESSMEKLAAAGVKLHLGKGALKAETVAALDTYQSYFAVTLPVSALFASKIINQRVVAFAEEGMEAFHELTVAGIPVIIAAANGKSIF